MNILEEYLVKLGFEADQPSFSKLTSLMAMAEKSVADHASGMTKFLLEAQGAIVGAFTSISAAIVGVVDKVAMTDQSYRLLGLQMLMTTESARKMDLITKALGADLGQIVWDRELHARALVMSEDIDRWSHALGPDFESKMKGVRDLRFEFSRLEIATKFLGMAFASRLADKLGLGDITGKVKSFVEGLDPARISAFADKLAGYAVPVLKETWLIVKDVGSVLKEAGVVFTNFIGLLSGDTSIEGTTFSFDKMAIAIEHVLAGIHEFIHGIALAEGVLAHLFSGVALGLAGKYSAAATEFKAALKDVTGASGAVLGAVGGGAIGPAVGGLVGGFVGGPAGAIAGTAFGGTVGPAIGAGAGYVFGKTREYLGIGEQPAPSLNPFEQQSSTPRQSFISPANPSPASTPRSSSSESGIFDRIKDWLTPNAPTQPTSQADLIEAITSAAAKYNVPRELALGIAQQESGINQFESPGVVKHSGAGALGIMQLMPATARMLGVDPEKTLQNIDGGIHYLADLLKHFSGDQMKAIAAYNAGPGRVDKITKFDQLPKETRNYVPRVLRYERQFAEQVKAQPDSAAGKLQSLSQPPSPDYETYRAPYLQQSEAISPNVGISKTLMEPNDNLLAYLQRAPGSTETHVTNNETNVTVDVGGINIMQPSADAYQIQKAVASGVRDGLRSQTQFDLAQLQPAW